MVQGCKNLIEIGGHHLFFNSFLFYRLGQVARVQSGDNVHLDDVPVGAVVVIDYFYNVGVG